MAAGSLKFRVRFEKRGTADDATYGEKRGDWVAQFTRWASMTPMKGGEEVMAQRLNGRQPFALTVYRDTDTLTITPDWRAVELKDEGGTRTLAIKSPPADLSGDKIYLTMMCEEGAADA